MKCKQIRTCTLTHYIVYAYVCINVMYTLHALLTLILKVLRNKTQPYSGTFELLLVASLAASWVVLGLT